MKNLIVIVALLLCLMVFGCQDPNSVRAWIWSDEGVGARVGTNITENNEAGISATLWEEDCEPRVLGFYVLRHLQNTVEFRNPFILDFLPPTLEAHPYIGGKFDRNFDTGETVIGPIGGVIIEDAFFIGYQPQSFEPGSTSVNNKVLFGLYGTF